jgi:hypothetical protein
MVPDASGAASPPRRREGEVVLLGFEALNATILVDVCVKRVSMPSLPAGALGRGRLAVFAGSVKERRMFGLDEAGGGACSAVLEAAGEDMAMASLGHRCRRGTRCVSSVDASAKVLHSIFGTAIRVVGERLGDGVSSLACIPPPLPSLGFTMGMDQRRGRWTHCFSRSGCG